MADIEDISEFSISYNDENRSPRIGEILKEFGVVVINDVFSNEECYNHMEGLVNGIEIISPQISSKTFSQLKKTWNDTNVMPQAKPGLFQHGYSFLGWPVRGSPQVNTVFKDAYSALRGNPVTELVTSLDGINVRPPLPPFAQN